MKLYGIKPRYTRRPFDREQALHPLLKTHNDYSRFTGRSYPVAKVVHRVITYVVRFRESRENRERTRRCDSERNPPEATVFLNKDRKAGE